MIKFSHSIFALPFALSSLFLASLGFPGWKFLGLTILCMVFARNTAMSFNRLVDSKMDAQNPRTATRHIPQGLISKKFAITFIVLNAAAFIFTSFFFNLLTFYLSPLALFIICFYSLTKKWFHSTQIFLGIALGVSPLAVWVAVTGGLAPTPFLLALGVLFWVAGFDLIYATQDYDFDKKNNVKSLVAKWGISKSLFVAKLFHILSLIFFSGLFFTENFGMIYAFTLFLIAASLVYEHSLVKPDDLSKVNVAFFTMNGFVGILFFAGVVADLVW